MMHVIAYIFYNILILFLDGIIHFFLYMYFDSFHHMIYKSYSDKIIKKSIIY